MNVKGTEIWVKVRADYEMYEPWVEVLVDGARTKRIMLDRGELRICLFRNMDGEQIRNVKLLRDTPAFPTDERTLLQVLEVRTDVVMVNLGTNDGTGTDDLGKIAEAVEGFLEKIRTCNPQCYILWCYGMLGNGIQPTLEQAIADYREKSGDDRVGFVELPDTLEGEFGSRQHPGHKSHRKAAKVLSAKVRDVLERE